MHASGANCVSTTGWQQPQQPSEPLGAWPTGQVGLVVWQSSVQNSPPVWGFGSALAAITTVAIVANKVVNEDFMAKEFEVSSSLLCLVLRLH